MVLTKPDEKVPGIKAIFCVGSSHIQALWQGHNSLTCAGKAGCFDTWKQIGTISHFEAGEYVLSDALDAEFAAIMSEVEVSEIFLCCGGAEHADIALFNIWPFDFYMPDDDPQQERIADSEVIPYDVMLATCAAVISRSVPFVQRIRSLSSLPMYHILPPPPSAIADPAKAVLAPGFREMKDRYGFMPPRLRQRVWRVCCVAARQIYEEMGISIIEPPAEALDENGFVAPQYQTLDMTHANSAYGELVASRMLSIAANHASEVKG
jgi:hypothetical protein